MAKFSAYRKGIKFFILLVALAILAALSVGRFMVTGDEPEEDETIGERPTLPGHMRQEDIESGALSFGEIFERGRLIFLADCNELDGAGRPEFTGALDARPRVEFPFSFNRSSGPDSNSCFGCHNKPRVAGGGDNVANVFVLAQRLPFTNSIGPEVANERNTLGMFGSGAIEMLAREMSFDLLAIRDEAIEQAVNDGEPVTRELITKGVRFGVITARPDGTIDTSGVEGVDTDLIVKPFNQKGTIVSLRVFSNNAMNHHHGMQSTEFVRVVNLQHPGTGPDPDGDGFIDELSIGDITTLTIFQAAQAIPGRRIPTNPVKAEAIRNGERHFASLGCAECHRPFLILNNPIYSEPNPFNPPGHLRPQEVTKAFTFDLTRDGPRPRLERRRDGSAIVRAFTDLKRHRMGELLNNEKLIQDGVATDTFLTKKLWGFASEPFFLHHGRATTITAAILAHGGEAQTARDNFAKLSQREQAETVEFLKSLVTLPEGTESLMVDGRQRAVKKDD